MQRRVEDVDAVDGDYAVADFERSLAIGRTACADVGHYERSRFRFVFVAAASHCETVRVELFFELNVDGLRAHCVRWMNCCEGKMIKF